MNNPIITYWMSESGLDPTIDRVDNVENSIIEKVSLKQKLSIYEYMYLFSLSIYLPLKMLLITLILMLPLIFILSHFIITYWFCALISCIISVKIVEFYYIPFVAILSSIVDIPATIIIGLIHWLGYI